MSDEKNNEVNEPAGEYRRITFFKSFEEANEYDHRYYASLSPEQSLNIVFEMRNRLWPDDRLSNPFGNRITFDE